MCSTLRKQGHWRIIIDLNYSLPFLPHATCLLLVAGGGGRRDGAAAGKAAPGENVKEDDDDGDNYEDDYDWEGEEEDVAVGPQSVGAGREIVGTGGGGERGKGGEGEGGGRGGRPSFLEQSFRESFASVNDVLSAIAGRNTTASVLASASSANDGTPTSAFNDIPRRHGARIANTTASTTRSTTAASTTTRSTSQTGRPETRAGYYSSAESASPVSPAPLSLRFSPPCSSKQGKPESGSLSAAAGGTNTAFSSALALGSSTTESPGRGEIFALATGAATGAAEAETRPRRGDGATAADGGEEMPPEMSGMLQRYSEMMLRVVQVRTITSATLSLGSWPATITFCSGCTA